MGSLKDLLEGRRPEGWPEESGTLFARTQGIMPPGYGLTQEEIIEGTTFVPQITRVETLPTTVEGPPNLHSILPPDIQIVDVDENVV